MKKLIVVVASLAGILHAAPPPDTCKQETWVTNGTVEAIAQSGNTIYVGGSFSQVGPYTGGGVPIGTSSGNAVGTFPKINGHVNAVCPDGNGGWFIGGGFTQVDKSPIKNIAHILFNGSVDVSWNPNVDSVVFALAVSGSMVYVGGAFTSIGGATRKYIAAIDAATGIAASWNPVADNSVEALAVSGSIVYAGGLFTGIGGAARNNIAALDAATGIATSWDPNANGIVNALAVSGTTVYVGGGFSSVGGAARNYIAAIDVATGTATAWNPTANGIVYALTVSGSTVYAGGAFISISGQTRSYIAALDSATGTATAWVPNANGVVYALAVSGTTVYAGGNFTSIGGRIRNHIAALDAATGNASAWNPCANLKVSTLAVSGSTIYAGGYFNGIGGQMRNNIASIDATTGKATAWDPYANSTVYSIAMSGAILYVGGNFTIIGDSTRNHIAAIDATSGNVTTWNPNVNQTVYALAVSGATVYAGGDFTSIGGQTRNYIAAIDITSGNATTWNPNANNDVYTLAASGTKIYAGGFFTSVGGQTRNHIAAIDATSGNATTWNPNVNNIVFTLAVSGTTVYAGGIFTSIGGQTRNYIAALDATSGNATTWNPNANSQVLALAVSGTTVYAGGAFTSIGNQSHIRIAAIDATTGNPTTWNPNANSQINALALSGTTIYAGGDFTSISQIGHSYFAQFGDYYPAPVVSSITPSSGTNNAIAQITNLAGSNFQTGATVKLTKAGQTDINATSVSVVSSTKITCNFDITGAAGGLWDVVVTNPDTKSGVLAGGFNIVSAPPVLVSPSNNAANLSLTPSLVWHKTVNDSLYTLQLSSSSSFSLRIINDNQITDTSVAIPPALLANNYTYYWKVAVTKKGGEVTAFSTPWSFTTIPVIPGTVTLISPADNAVNTPVSQTMRWNSLSGAVSYRMQIATDSLFGTLVRNDSLLTDTTDTSSTLLNNTRYFWHVRAINAGGAGPWSATGRFTTIPVIPGAVTLLSPADNATNTPVSQTMRWTRLSGAVSYRMQIATDSLFGTLVRNDSLLTDTTDTSSTLLNNTRYFWHVRAINAGGAGPWSATGRFTTIPVIPGTVTLLSPADNATNTPVSLAMRWNRLSGAVSYRMQIATDSLFGTLVRNDSLLTDTTDTSSTLLNNTRYFWHVKAINPGGAGPWSAIGRFTTIIALPGQVTIKMPALGDTVKTDSVFLVWSKVSPNVDKYRLEYANDSSFTTPTIDSALTDTVKLVKGLQTATKVWWRVQAHNLAGWGNWCAKSSFNVKIPANYVRNFRTPKEFSFNISGRNGIISYSLPKAESVTLQIYNLNGKLQSEMVNTRQEAGFYTIRQSDLTAAGTYLVVFKAGNFYKRKLLNLMR